MRNYIVTIILCAFFCSAFAASSHKKIDLVEAATKTASPLKTLFKSSEHDSSDKTNNKNSERLILTYNPKTQIQLIANETAQTVPVLDSFSNISTLYNGKTGSAVSFNFETGITIYIPGPSAVTWDSSKTSFSDFFSELPSQRKIYEYGETHGVRFDPTTVPEDAAEEMAAMLQSVSQEYKERCEAMSVVLQISRITSNYFKTSMLGYSQVMGHVNAEFRGDLKWLFGFYQGLGELFAKIDGGMSLLAEKKLKLDLGKLLTAKTGFHVLSEVVEVLDQKFVVGTILGKDLNNVESFFPLVDMLGGMLGYGFDGFVHVVTEIIKFYGGHTSIQNVEVILKEYGSSSKTNSSVVKEMWKGSISDFLDTVENLNKKEGLEGLTKFLEDIRNDNLNYNGINIGKIIKTLSELDPAQSGELIPEILNLLKGTSTLPQIVH